MHTTFRRRLQQATAVNAVAKLAVYGLVFVFWNAIWSGLYTEVTLLFITVFVLTLIGLVADLVIVPMAGTLWSLLGGFPAMVLLTWWIASLGPDNHMTFWRAVFIALTIGPFEYLLHRLVMQITGLRNRL